MKIIKGDFSVEIEPRELETLSTLGISLEWLISAFNAIRKVL